MMGLGNGRRTMKSPPFVLAALVACIIVLGFNYWMASSRSVDLQTRILELEGRVRRAAAERGAVELKKNEFQGELEKQREQLDQIQSSHNLQMESVNRLHQDEKAVLVNNITAGEKLIRTLQDQLKALQKNYGRLQQDVLQFQKNQTNLERKFSYDLSQCISQMKEVKEQCEEQIEEVTKKGNEAVASRDPIDHKEPSQQLRAPSEPQPRLQEAGLPPAEVPQAKGNMPRNDEPQTPGPGSEAALDLRREGEKEETNDIQVISKEALRRDGQALPQEPDHKQQAVEAGGRPGGRGMGDVRDLGQTPRMPATLLMSQEDQEVEEPEQDQLVVRDGQEEEPDADEEGRNEQKVGGDDDYNMDENEAESETDKQAALAGNDRNVNVLNAENQKREDKFT
ncbi:Golgi membrane protein 1 isoform X1 [Pipistrellus kuhlii]|uniref:Golgi membrane protein 1 n=1 Tax=Pipistrellus kuhlii TaxID=59472 RepID=A0A7J7W2U4_PIPKU|nr:Golgi membrane protein 1 isoform X1 [Pipistrellus kuhlii]XP_045436035.1 Golgi membrane protein 1 isoform X1 [Pipistrellus kuhlii]KAF6331739.1 golgi membrane protein 1 [Pipistrellus kuhlii]